MKQLHFHNTFKPKHWSKLSKTQHQMVLELHMFLKEIRDQSLKGRTVAGGNKQQDYISKEDASLPTVTSYRSCAENSVKTGIFKILFILYRSCADIVHHGCQGRKGCCCNQYPKCIYPDASRRRRGYDNLQDSWSPRGYPSSDCF